MMIRVLARESDCNVEEDRKSQLSNQWLLHKSGTSKSTPFLAGDRNIHGGCSKDFKFINRAQDIEQLKGKGITAMGQDHRPNELATYMKSSQIFLIGPQSLYSMRYKQMLGIQRHQIEKAIHIIYSMGDKDEQPQKH